MPFDSLSPEDQRYVRELLAARGESSQLASVRTTGGGSLAADSVADVAHPSASAPGLPSGETPFPGKAKDAKALAQEKLQAARDAMQS